MSRTIDADALIEILTTAIRNMKGMAKSIGAEDDPEIQMEIKAYTDIANGVRGMPTIEPERKKGKWIVWNGMDIPENHGKHKCSECGEFAPAIYDKPIIREQLTKFCPNCGCYCGGENEI